jgi:hypothetical protein
MFGVQKQKASKREISSTSTAVKLNKPAKQKPAGRERLRHFDSELAKANQAAAEIEARIQRLEKIISDADSAHDRLQVAILVDNGASLASYSSGQATDDSEIGRLVIAADTTARAKAAAVAALPSAQASLQNVREQAVALDAERVAELNRFIATLADVEARAYQKAFEEMCRMHDRLVGYARVAENNIGDIRLVEDPLKTPRFALPSLGNSDSDPFLRHRTNDHVIAESERMWSSVKQRLQADTDADLSDLI